MKTMPVALKNRLDSGVNILVRVDLITLTLVDGVTIFRWTTSPINITIGPNTWLRAGSAAPNVIPGPLTNAMLPAIDQTTLTLIGGDFTINGQSLTLAASAGYFDGARVQIDRLMGPDLPTALSDGPILKNFEGRVGECAPDGDSLTMPIAAESVTLAKLLPFVVLQPSCNYSVYDTNCALSQAAFTLSGAASGVPTTKTVPTTSVALTAKAAGYFNLGVITFTGGALSGVSADIDSWSGTTFTLSLPLPVAPTAGDTFTVYPGCDLKRATCNGKFANLVHWRGYNHIPSPESGS